jgi:hypothetical protein
MSTRRLLLLCLPTILVTLASDFVPWGLATAVITLIAYGVILFLPSKSWAKVNANVALEGLSHGDVAGAKDHIEIALREAESASSLAQPDLEILRNASSKIASALVAAGQADAGNSILRRAESIAARFSKDHGA